MSLTTLNSIWRRFIKRPATLLLLVAACWTTGMTGCSTLKVNNLRARIAPSNDRNWRPEVAVSPRIEINGPQYHIRNIRNASYLSADDYVVDHYDRQILADQIQSVDYIVVPFGVTGKLAHTMISFGLDDGSHLAVSVEVRKEIGEEYNPVLGVGRQYEIIYVVGDERDLIRVRTRHYDSDVYIYPSTATPQQAQALFADMATRINKLAVDPEFYHSITNNCTTNLANHVNQLSPQRIKYGWRVLLPGLSAQYAYDLGLIDNRIPFDDLTSIALVNNLSDEYFDDPNFSQRIRSRHHLIDREIARQSERDPILRGSGDQYLRGLLPPLLQRFSQ